MKMNINYKLMKPDMTTHNGFQWRLGEWKEATGDGNRMCSDAVLHYYKHPVLALLFNPVHANIDNPRIFKIECSDEVAFDGLKAGCKRQKPLSEVFIPAITTEQRIEFSIRVAMKVYNDDEFIVWADKWLKGEDRSARAAEAAARAAAEAAAWAAWAAAWAAEAAARAAAEIAAGAAEAAARAAAEAAARAARAAEIAAGAADKNVHNLFIEVLAEMGFDQ